MSYESLPRVSDDSLDISREPEVNSFDQLQDVVEDTNTTANSEKFDYVVPALDESVIRTNLKLIYSSSDDEPKDVLEPAAVSEITSKAFPQAVENKKEKISFEPRKATVRDIPELVEVDMRAFSAVYKGYDMTEEELRQDLTDKFMQRLQIVGGDWVTVLEKKGTGQICGFLTSCPTNKTPEEFVSWEQTTDEGTLETTYDPEGKNVYVVSLSMLPEGAKADGQNMLFAHQIGSMIEQGRELAFFESRIPGLRSYMKKQCRLNKMDIDTLSAEQQQQFAEDYTNLRVNVKDKNGTEKSVRKDRLLRIYEEVGCDFNRVVADAYQDKPSMNFGVVCTLTNPLPEKIRQNSMVKMIAGRALKFISKSQKIMGKAF